MKYAEERAEVVRYAQEMEERDLTFGTSGNVSRRVEEGALVTPSTLPYGEMRPEDVVLMDLDGGVLEGERVASVEHKVHLICYKTRPEVGGVIHSHPRIATAFAAARVSLPAFLDEFGVFIGEEVRVAEYAMSGSEEIAGHLARALGEDSNAAFLASHGMVTVGKTLADAMRVARSVERAALTYIYSQILGGAKDLPQDSKDLFRQVFQYFRTS